MPAKLHRKLAAMARKKGYKGERYRRYVYGGLYNAEHGRQPRRRAKKKGAR